MTSKDASKFNILIVDDVLQNIQYVANTLKNEHYQIAYAISGKSALELINKNRFDLILLDIIMPDMNGFEVCKYLKAHTRTQDIPIIFLTGKEDPASLSTGFEMGAVDYVTKPFNGNELSARVKTHVELNRSRKALEDHRNTLEDMVKERTQELLQTNTKLQEEILIRKETLQALEESEKKLSAIIEATDGIIYTCTKDNRIEFMNQASIAYCGQKAIGQTCHQSFFGLTALCPWCGHDRVWKGETVKYEFQNKKDGKWFYVINSPIVEQKGKEKGTVIKKQTLMIDVTDRKIAEQELKDREANLIKENLRLKSSIQERFKLGRIIGKSRPMQEVYELIIKAASTDAYVLVYGESGTGKELVARAIHDLSDRKEKKYIPVNCSAISENLLESEFFGYKKGAFTGAEKDQKGILDIADGGTLFLDELGDIPLNMQIKLLRAIEGGGYTPVGGRELKYSHFRIISATNKNIRELVRKGIMREDFYYRINILKITLSPLRERKEDIPLLVDHFLKDVDPANKPLVNGKILDILTRYDWPGNVRELQNTIQRYQTTGELSMLSMAPPYTDESDEILSGGETHTFNLDEMLKQHEKKCITKILETHQWHRSKAAAALGISRRTLLRKMKIHGFPLLK